MAATALRLEEEERHIVEILPLLLKKDPRFRREVTVILSETLATKDDLRQILEELRVSREETNRRFEESDRRFDALVQEMREGFELQSKAMSELEIKVDNGLQATRDLETKVDNLETKVDNGFELQSKATKDLETKVDNGLKAIGIKIDTVGSRWELFAEATIRNTLKELLLKNLDVTEVKEWRVQDKDGVVFGYSCEIQGDLLIKNGENYLVEIKSSAGSNDVSILNRKAKFYEQLTGVMPKTIFVAVNMNEEGKKSCQALNVQLISYDEIKD